MALSNEHEKRASGGKDEPSAIPVVMGVTTPETQAVPIYTSDAPIVLPMPAARSVEVVAPIALAGGYQFHVAEANQTLLVEVVGKHGCFLWCVSMEFLRRLISESVGVDTCVHVYMCVHFVRKKFILCILAGASY
jgi:hypothetical protein